MNEPFKKGAPSMLTISKWQEQNSSLKVGFTTRIGGHSKQPFETFNLGLHVNDDENTVVTNRKQLANQLGMPIDTWVSGEQVHQTKIHVVTSGDKGRGATDYYSSISKTDGLITKEKGLLCTAFFADCVPLFFFDPQTEYIGIAHAGWKGSVNNMAKKMVEQFIELGVSVNNLQVVIGPSISRSHYQVDQRVIENIDEVLKKSTVIPITTNQFLLDLKQLNMEILLQVGLSPRQIEVTKLCTYEDESLFYSHRRDQGKTGRMLGFIGYAKEL